ncbi:MAG TPA: hypothetical protein VKH63_04735 [Candidatus Acidoferrum sp.]|jgi:hypothetical protein|nr:hypothetical protein [Candidatus Acidoferrum sp.]
MEILTKFRIGALLIAVTASSALFAQNKGSDKPPNQPIVQDARQIVSQSLVAAELSWQARNEYIYMERDEDRRLDSAGQVQSQNVDVTKMTLVNGIRFEELMEHNGQLPSADDQKKRDVDIEKLKHETTAEQAERLRKDQDNRSFLHVLLEAFDFRLVGEEIVDGRPAYVLEATPHPGYHASGKYGKLLARVQGKLWVDKQDFGWVKVDGEVTQSFSMGLFVARVQRGSHILLEQICLGDAVWVPKRLEVRASAKILFLKSLELERILTYSDYRPAADGPYSVKK